MALGDVRTGRSTLPNSAQATVDNALTRYFIIHAHKLLDPREDEHEDGHDH